MFRGIQRGTRPGFACWLRISVTKLLILTAVGPMLTYTALPCIMIGHVTLCPAIRAITGLRLHVGTQNGVNAGLVAAALLLEPFHDIMVHPDRQAFLWLRYGELGFLPKRFIQLGDIGVVDFLIAHFAQASEVSFALRPR